MLTLLSLLHLSLSRSLCQREEEDEEEEEERAKRSRRSGTVRRPGDRWMLRGPIEYVPPAAVEVVLRRQAIPLDENEGIYVRDIKTGKVRVGGSEDQTAGQDCRCSLNLVHRGGPPLPDCHKGPFGLVQTSQ